jgi:hypothetical protein
MNLRPLALALIVAAMAFTLVSALLTRDGVGSFEWIIGVALFVLLVWTAVRLSRHAFRRA